jgi:hypothetical protein
MNFPDGVNLMANTAVLGLGIPMVPVTMAFGPAVSFVVLVAIGLAGTAAAWYFVLSRHVVRSRFAAAVGGWFCGFSPAMLSHANWHPNIISQFLLPFIVWRVVVLTRSRHAVRDGLVLAGLVTYQAFINEEILLLTAMGCGVFMLAMFGQQRRLLAASWRPLGAGLAVCAVTAGVLLAYPLYVQFVGRQSYSGLGEFAPTYGNDLAAFVRFGSTTVGGSDRANAGLAPNWAEENAFFGWLLIILCVAALVWLWADRLVRALAFTGVFFAILSMGSELSVFRFNVGAGPWALFCRVPVLDTIIPTRFGLITSCVVGILLAVATDRVLAVPDDHRWALRGMWVTGLAFALVPLAPLPLHVRARAEVPEFITSGEWRSFVQDGQTLVPVPVPTPSRTDGLRWAAAARLGFAIPGGYFLAPRGGRAGETGQFGGRRQGTVGLLDSVSSKGIVPELGDADVRRVYDDLREWQAAVMVLPAGQHNADALRRTLDKVVGPARRIDDAWVWDVRPITRATA